MSAHGTAKSGHGEGLNLGEIIKIVVLGAIIVGCLIVVFGGVAFFAELGSKLGDSADSAFKKAEARLSHQTDDIQVRLGAYREDSGPPCVDRTGQPVACAQGPLPQGELLCATSQWTGVDGIVRDLVPLGSRATIPFQGTCTIVARLPEIEPDDTFRNSRVSILCGTGDQACVDGYVAKFTDDREFLNLPNPKRLQAHVAGRK